MIVAIEPNPVTYTLLRRNVVQLGDRVKTLQAALGSTTGFRTLYGMSEASGTSFFGPSDVATAEFRVPTLTLDEVIANCGSEIVDVLKMDIEGAEHEVFRTISVETLRRIRLVLVECHPGYGVDVATIVSKLRESGMRVSQEGLRGTTLIVGWQPT